MSTESSPWPLGEGQTQPKLTDGKTATNTSTTNKPSTDILSTEMSLTPISSTQMSLMESRQLHSGQQEALKKIPEFSGEDNEEDIEEWLLDLTSLFSLMKLTDETKMLETMGKLTGPALKWYQQQLSNLSAWEDITEALQERFKKPTSTNQLVLEFLQLRQEENQSIISFYEIVVRKSQRIKRFITEQQVITVLIEGVKCSLKPYLIRKEKQIDTPEKWLKLAREEEFVQQRLQQHSDNIAQVKSTSTLPMATINPQPMRPKYDEKRNQSNEYYRKNQPTRKSSEQIQRKKKCLVCNRSNHSTDQCYQKKEKGCYKCGQPDHRIRDCPKRNFFE